MLTVIESPEFIACAAKVWGDDERHAFVDWISENPEAGDVIANSGSLRKVRWSRAGMGKRAGARVIYFVRNARDELVLVTVYTKGRIENIPAHLLRALKEKYDV
ncbi:MAG: transcriptional regulator [Rhodoferax sp.]|nr:transcriptional regulator [Rhodoferax sp.]